MRELILLSAIVREGHLKYKVDELSDAVRKHYLALKVKVKMKT